MAKIIGAKRYSLELAEFEYNIILQALENHKCDNIDIDKMIIQLKNDFKKGAVI